MIGHAEVPLMAPRSQERGWSTDETLRFANAAAAVSCTRLGALGGIPSLEEVEAQAATGRMRT